MFTKKLIQVLLLVVMLVSSLFTTGNAYAASICGNAYTVVSGDTLRSIAAACGTTVFALRRANPEIGLGNLIYPGQVLYLPGAILYGGNGYNTYIIARGDTLKALAARFYTSMDALVSLNPDITNINVIYEGQRLVVPTGQVIPGPTPQPVPGMQVYTVQWGDTLRKIAARFDTSVEALLQANPQIWNPNWIFAGQQVNIPGGSSSYVVQPGDTLKKIAARFGTSYESLLALNPQITNPNLIYVGQIIRIW